ncbi:hypothetical protein M501DRAFT_1002190, partial [Patellaria atrata CBS 101060]
MLRTTVLKLKSIDNLVDIGVLTQPYFQIWPVAVWYVFPKNTGDLQDLALETFPSLCL